jgi:hypothetical protein
MFTSSLSSTGLFSRRDFLGRTYQWSALLAAYQLLPLPALAESFATDSRVAQAPIVDKGFASVGKSASLYAQSPTHPGSANVQWWIPVRQKRRAANRGFVSPAGASSARRTLSQAPSWARFPCPFSHVTGNAFYGANGISLWAHAAVSTFLTVTVQCREWINCLFNPFEARKNAKSESRGNIPRLVATMGNILALSVSHRLGFPNRPLDPANFLRNEPGRLDARRNNIRPPART